MQEVTHNKDKLDLKFFQMSDGTIKRYDECHSLWSVNKHYNTQVHSNQSRRKKIRINHDDQLERKMKVIDRLKKKLEEKKL